jgi:hypothetical protein
MFEVSFQTTTFLSLWHVGWCGTGWTSFPNPVQSVWQRCSYAMSPPRRFGPPRGRYGHHSHVMSVLEKAHVLCNFKEQEI